MSVPIRQLQAGAEQLGEGDLAQRVAVSRRDEIGALADRFNTMASRLQQSQKGFEAKIDDRTEGLDIARQQQELTVDMLRTISRSDYHLEQVLDTLIGSAVQLAEANVGAVWLREGDAFRLAAQLGHTREWVDAARKTPFTAGSDTHAMAAAAAYSGQVINVDDVLRDVRFAGDYGERPAYSDERSALALPLKEDGKVVAVFALSRADPIAFTDRQATLAQDFADQALIAVRHMLLLREIAMRDGKLARSSEEQAATGDILHVIARTPDNPQPALDAIARNAARLCDAPFCHIELFDGERLHFKVGQGLPAEATELVSQIFPAKPLPGTAAARAIESGAVAVVADTEAEQEIGALSALLRSKSVIAVPLLTEGQPVGVLSVERQVAGALPAQQIELLKSFADQAAIALESGRLAGELRTRSSNLSASFGREAATGALLQAVSRTDYDLTGVLAGLGRRAARDCTAEHVQFFRLDGEVLRDSSGGEAGAEGHSGLARRVIAGAAAVNMADAWQDPAHAGRDAANRSMLGLPLLAKGVVGGAMTLSRSQILPFDEEQAKLAAELADQAALAVAGHKLPAELAERTAERDDWRSRHAADTEAAEQRRVTEIDEALRSHAAELAEIHQRHDAELSETRRLHAEELAQRTSERDESRRLHVADVEAAEQRRVAEMDEVLRSHAAEMEATLQGHATELEHIRQQHEAQVGDILQRHADELAERTAERDEWHRRHTVDTEVAEQQRLAELDEVRRLHAEETEETRQRHEAELADLLHRHADELAERTAERDEWHRRHTVDTEAAEQRRIAEQDEASRLHAAETGETRQRHEAELAEMQRRHAGELQEAIAAHDARLAETIGAYTAQMDETLHLHAAQTAEAQRFREAVANVLDLVGSVDADPQQALDAVVATAAELCGAQSAEIDLAEGGTLSVVASAGTLGGDIAAARRAVAEGRVVHVAGAAEAGAALAIPLMLDGSAAGSLALRRETGAFSEREIELARTLAAQAAIAVAQARLAVALAGRSRRLAVALAEREATARMLATLSHGGFDLGGVLGSLAGSAAELCGAETVAICLDSGGILESAASIGLPEAWLGDAAHAQAAGLVERAMREATPLQSFGTVGDILAVPLSADGRTIGALLMVRAAPFGGDDVAVASLLADQAAIAIGNVRLLDQLAARGAELGETLRQQAAVAAGLRAIGRSEFALDGVLSSLTTSAAALCGAAASTVHLLGDGAYHLAAATGLPPDRLAHERSNAHRPGRGSWVGRTALDKAVIHVPDAANDIEYPEIDKTSGAVLSVPLLRDGVVAGVFMLMRPDTGSFDERQIGLVQSFADQAAIAIETVRLADAVETRTAEINETLRQQTAVAYALRTMNRSAFDLDKVLTALTASAATLCNVGSAEIHRLQEGAWRLSAATPPEPAADVPGRDAWIARAAMEKAAIHVPDLGEEPGHQGASGSILCVPLMRGDAVAGVFALARSQPAAFTERQIELVRTFADQAVIAVEGVRLAETAQASSGELAETLQGLHTLQKRVGEMERLASLGQHTSGIAGEIRSSLDSLTDFSARSNGLVNDIRMVLESAVLDSRVREEVEELGDTLKANLDRVVDFGRRADSIVVNALTQNGDAGSDGPRPVDINAVVDESLGIAYHGARAQRQDFDVRLEKAYDPAAGRVDLYPQEIARALLHVISNGFHATARRSAEADGMAYQPVLAASTKNLGDAVEIRIRDNGAGMAPEVQAKLFNPFFTTRPAGEGAGLGLSLSRDIIVRQHSGTIDVETVPGAFTEFRIVLPRGGAALAKSGDAQSS
ncbi:MAG TPA: GAF domain-containing protein [Rhizobiaceae bacterium]